MRARGWEGYCVARNAREAAACVSVCVTLMDAPMERRTDAWADLTARSGEALHTFAARLGRKHLRSAETNPSPEPFSEPGERRRKRATWRYKSPRNKERKAAEFRFRADPPKRAVSLAADERESRGGSSSANRRSENGGFGELTFTAPHGSLPWFSFVHATSSA